MKFITFIIIYLIQIHTYASTDFSLCNEYFQATANKYNMTGFLFPFSLREDGGIKPENTQFFNFSLSENSATFRPTNPSLNVPSSFNQYNIKLDGNKIQEVSVTSNNGNVAEITFEYRNDKCIPNMAQNSFEFNGIEQRATIFDLNLCKDINDFFLNKPDLAECLKADSQASKSITNIFDKHGYSNPVINNPALAQTQQQAQSRYSYTVEQRVLTGSRNLFSNMPGASEQQNNHFLGVLGGNPTISAYMILKDCEEKGLAPSINDSSIWSNSTQSPPQQAIGVLPN